MSRLLSIVLLALALLAASFAGCGVTAGRAIEVTFSAGLDASGTVRTAAGWDVTLARASISLGPIYVRAPALRRTAMLRALVLPTALAHGGTDEYASLDVRAEWLDEVVVEAGAPAPIGLGRGIAGPAERTTVHLVPPADASGPTHGHLAWVEGTATPVLGGETIAFEGGLDLPDDPLARTIESIPSVLEMPTHGAFELVVLAAPSGERAGPSWLEDAHFDRLPPPASGAVRMLAPGTQPYVAWTLALRDSLAWATRFEPVVAP